MSFSEFHSEFESENELPFVLPDQDYRGLYDLACFVVHETSPVLDQNNSFNPSIQMSNPYEWEWKQSFLSVFENENKEEEEDDESRYFISSSKSKEITPEEVSCCQIKKNPFKVKKIDTSEEMLQKKNKKG